MPRTLHIAMTTLAIAVSAVAAHLSGGHVHVDLQVAGRRRRELRREESGRARHLERRLVARRRRRVAGARVERAGHAGGRDLPHRAEGRAAPRGDGQTLVREGQPRRRGRRAAGECRHTAGVQIGHLGESELRHALGLLRLRVERCVRSRRACRRRRSSSSKPRFTACRATSSCGRRSARPGIRATCARSSRSS